MTNTPETIDTPEAVTAPHPDYKVTKAGATQGKAKPRRKIVARGRDKAGNAVHIVIGAAWWPETSGPTVFAERITMLPLGDALVSLDRAEIMRFSGDGIPLATELAGLHGRSLSAPSGLRSLIEAAGLAIPDKAEPLASFSSKALIFEAAG